MEGIFYLGSDFLAVFRSRRLTIWNDPIAPFYPVQSISSRHFETDRTIQ
jgi:hypothetical protein